HGVRVFTADEYVAYCGTHSDHIVIPEPYKTEFFEGLREVALRYGDRVEYRDTYRLYLARKPL
ncbi:MAG: SAM-dependent methyltransferase, partial [Oscillospiraceae bacterium]|nr:SAM-dependent methyltransferase [Oscillospiraceae bacterium]